MRIGGLVRAKVVRACEGMLVIRAEAPSSVDALLRSVGMSKASAARALAADQVSCAGAALASGMAVEAGDELEVSLAPTHEPGPAAAMRAEVLWEDPFVLAALKPAGILVHDDGVGDPAATLTARVQAHLAAEGSPAVAQALQRLDVPTTGIVLFSKTEQLQPAFDALVSGGGLQKRYLAVVRDAIPAGTTNSLDAPIGRDRHDAHRMRVSPTGKPALTVAQALASAGGTTLMLVELGSGRRHQIRVHLAHAGHPIVGDALYGGSSTAGAHGAGLMLHCWEEAFVHPVTGEHIAIEAPWPERFVRAFGKGFSASAARGRAMAILEREGTFEPEG